MFGQKKPVMQDRVANDPTRLSFVKILGTYSTNRLTSNIEPLIAILFGEFYCAVWRAEFCLLSNTSEGRPFFIIIRRLKGCRGEGWTGRGSGQKCNWSRIWKSFRVSQHRVGF